MSSTDPSNTYHLLRRFNFPVNGGAINTVAFHTEDISTIVSFYTLMTKLIIGQVWGLIVLFTVAFFMSKCHTQNRAVFTVGVFNSQSSTSSVLLLIWDYLFVMKGEVLYLLLWIALTALAFGVGVVAPLLVSRALVVGQAAPVNVDALWLPSKINVNGNALNRAYALETPWIFRSMGQAGLDATSSVFVEAEPSSSPDFQRINYGYQITGADFGFQDFSALKFVVNGSCYTEYSWLTKTTPDEDDYNVFNTTYAYNIYATEASDGGPPYGIVFNGAVDRTQINRTWAIIISARNRSSFSAGTDPWYLTAPTGNTSNPFTVEPGRPALFCWETNVFELNGVNASVDNMNTLHPTLDYNSFIYTAIQAFLVVPMISKVGQLLSRASLASAQTLFNNQFDAGSCSIYSDLQRLVQTSYIATKNSFVECTRYSSIGRDEFLNLALAPNTSTPLPGAGDFVIPTTEATALSFRVLIIIPVVLVITMGLAFLLKHVPAPWRIVDVLNGTILYSYLHQWAVYQQETGDDWFRKGSTAYAPVSKEAKIEPVRKGKEGQSAWVRTDTAVNVRLLPWDNSFSVETASLRT
ncbi:hypothetical protein BDZ45DRAFT_779992 [Acephala macrosclerotiorum]|nr:hypothetical protein BDZ45DRAFT_779992 [Acephala macrosclerotiorum]